MSLVPQRESQRELQISCVEVNDNAICEFEEVIVDHTMCMCYACTCMHIVCTFFKSLEICVYPMGIA